MQQQETWLTLREAADALGISEVSARRWVKSGKLAASKPGKKYWIPRSAIDELLRPVTPDRGEADTPTMHVTHARLAGHGIALSDADLTALNRVIEAHMFMHRTGHRDVDVYVPRGANRDRVEMALRYVLTAPGLLTPEQLNAIRDGARSRLMDRGVITTDEGGQDE